jgi:parallel beta-helix repeat protein
VLIESGGSLDLRMCTISNNHGHALSCNGGSTFRMKECTLQGNSGGGLYLRGDSNGQLAKCRFVRNGSIIDKESGCSCAPCTGNIAIVSSVQRAVPGFRLVNEDEPNDEAVPANVESSLG